MFDWDQWRDGDEEFVSSLEISSVFNANDVLFVLISFRFEAPVERALIDSDPDHPKALKDNRYVREHILWRD